MTNDAENSSDDDPTPDELGEIEAVADRFETEWKPGQPVMPWLKVSPKLQTPKLQKALLAKLMERLCIRLESESLDGQVPEIERYVPDFEELEFAASSAQLPSFQEFWARARREAGDFEPPPPDIKQYEIVEKLGQGNFGTVYKARHRFLGHYVAIKVLNPERCENRRDREALINEAKLLAERLDHENIVRVLDAGEMDDGQCYVVSQFIDGMDLAKIISHARPSHFESAKLVAAVADALHYAHTPPRCVVHRDVKPANILVNSEGKPYLADFGLAMKEEDLGKGPQFVGTPIYMSPEQAQELGHRIDGRSDIFSLGVVFYELLTGRRPFRGETRNEILWQIVNQDARPPRQIDDKIPKELERICLKCLSRRIEGRYTTAKDLHEDLCASLQDTRPKDLPSTPQLPPSTTPVPDSELVRIIPKGLRSFNKQDAEFFLELLPGPRDRDGLPDSVRFWKTRIEQTDPDDTFAVGLIYGPSGCGKSSLVKAGILPQLAENVTVVYIEAGPEGTETRLVSGLRQTLPSLDEEASLTKVLAALRRGQVPRVGKKVLLVLDQFEQWLHAHRAEESTSLVRALKQCDGQHLQCLLLVRDDFWMSATRFMRELEIPLSEGRNSAAVDLFDLRHARKVLRAFGRAYGTLPEEGTPLTTDQEDFVEQALAGLAQDGKVVPVRLALFGEMVKSKDWTPETLESLGGAKGVGIAFLEETFTGRTAAPEHRLHRKAAQAILKALLPAQPTAIRGHIRSYGELLAASGYAGRQSEFESILDVLDQELRLITPVDPENLDFASDGSCQPDPDECCYQLTHDYLVPSIQEWLTRQQQRSRRGRMQLWLAERAALWEAKPDKRHLPDWWEHLLIRTSTRRRDWTEAESRMMEASAQRNFRRIAVRIGTIVAVLLALLGSTVVSVRWAKQAEDAKSDLVRKNIELDDARKVAENKAREADEARRKADHYRKDVQVRLAENYLNHGFSQCEQGEVGLGMLFFVRSLETLPTDDATLQNAIRCNIATWSKVLYRLKAILPHSEPIVEAKFAPTGNTVLTVTKSPEETGPPQPGGLVVPGTGNKQEQSQSPVVPSRLPSEQKNHAVPASPGPFVAFVPAASFTARLWDIDAGTTIATRCLEGAGAFEGFGPAGSRVEIGPNGKTIEIQKKASPFIEHNLEGDGYVIASSSDGKIAAIGKTGGSLFSTGERVVKLWNIDTKKTIASLEHDAEVLDVTFSPNSTRVATGSADKTARVWHADSGKPIVTLTHSDVVSKVYFSPDGRTLLTITGGQGIPADFGAVANLWDVTSGKQIGLPLRRSSHEILTGTSAVAFSHDSKMVATGSTDGTVQLWDVGTAAPVGPRLHHPAKVDIVDFSPGDSALLTVSVDNTLRVWSLKHAEPFGGPVKCDKHTLLPVRHSFPADVHGAPQVLGLHGDGWRWSTSSMWVSRKPDTGVTEGATARLWTSKAEVAEILKHLDSLSGAAFSPDGNTFLTVANDELWLWDAGTNEFLGACIYSRHPITDVAFAPNGKKLLIASYGNIELWDLGAQPNMCQSFACKDEDDLIGGCHVRFVLGGKAVVAQGLGATYFWYADSGELALTLKGGVFFSSDGTMMLRDSRNATFGVWRIDRSLAGAEEPDVSFHRNEEVGRAVFSPDAKSVATVDPWGGSTVHIWSIDTANCIATLEHNAPVSSLAFSRDSNTLLTGSTDKSARLWNPRTGELIAALQHSDEVTSVAFSPDGKCALTGAKDGTARLWSIAKRNCLFQLRYEWADSDSLSSLVFGGVPPQGSHFDCDVAFSPDGTLIATSNSESGSLAAIVHLWKAHDGEPFRANIKFKGRLLAVNSGPARTIVLSKIDERTTQCWDATAGETIDVPERQRAAIVIGCISPDSTIVAIATDDGTVRLRQLSSSRTLAIRHFAHPIYSLAFTQNGKRLVTMDSTKALQLCEVPSLQPVSVPLPRVQEETDCLLFSPDCNRMARWNPFRLGTEVQFLGTRLGKKISSTLQHDAEVISAAFSPTGNLLATGGVNGVRYWDGATGKPIGPPIERDKAVRFTAFSPDGRQLLTGEITKDRDKGDPRNVFPVLWQVPHPPESDPAHLTLWTNVVIGMTLDDSGAKSFLDAKTWRSRKKQLQELERPPLP